MAVVDTYYTPYARQFNAGQPALASYWASFVGTRTQLNRDKMKAAMAGADPAMYQDQIDGLRSAIMELEQTRAKVGRDLNQGLGRLADSTQRGELAAYKARIDAQGRIAATKITAELGYAELESEEAGRIAEITAMPGTSETAIDNAIIAALNATSGAKAQQELRKGLTDALSAASAGHAGPKADAIRYHMLKQLQLAEGQLIQAGEQGKLVVLTQGGGFIKHHFGSDPEGYMDGVLGVRDETAREARRQRGLSHGVGGGTGAGYGGAGGGGGGGDLSSVLAAGAAGGDRYSQLAGHLMAGSAETAAGLDGRIAKYERQLAGYEQKQADAMQQRGDIFTATTSNPMLAPAFTRRHRHQGVIDTLGQATGRQIEEAAITVGLDGDGDPRRVRPGDIARGESNPGNIAPSMTGGWLFSHMHREMVEGAQKIYQAADSGDAAMRDEGLAQINSVVRLAQVLPPSLRREHTRLLREVEKAGQASAAAMFADDPHAAADAAHPAMHALANQLDEGDIHFGEIVADAIDDANDIDDGTQSMGVLADLVDFAEVAPPELSGALGPAVVRSFETRLAANDGAGIKRDMVALGQVGVQGALAVPRPAPMEIPRPQTVLNAAKAAEVEQGLVAAGHTLPAPGSPPTSHASVGVPAAEGSEIPTASAFTSPVSRPPTAPSGTPQPLTPTPGPAAFDTLDVEAVLANAAPALPQPEPLYPTDTQAPSSSSADALRGAFFELSAKAQTGTASPEEEEQLAELAAQIEQLPPQHRFSDSAPASRR